MPRFNEGFEYEVPFAWVDLVRNESRPCVLIARTRWVDWSKITNIHSDLQGDGTASLETSLNEASAVGFGSENRGPRLRFVDQRSPPGLANVCQLQEGVNPVPSARRREEVKDLAEDLDRNLVNGTTLSGRARVALTIFPEKLNKRPRRRTSGFLALLSALGFVYGGHHS